MNLEDFETRCRQAFQANSQTEVLVREFAELDGERRVNAWTYLTRKGIEDVDFIKFVHANFALLVLEVFGTPVSEKVT